MFFVSAIRTYSRGWPRSSSTHEPSDPPLRMESRRFFMKFSYTPITHQSVKVSFLNFNFVFRFSGGHSSTRLFFARSSESTTPFTSQWSIARIPTNSVVGNLAGDSLNLSSPPPPRVFTITRAFEEDLRY